jgi:hypothetical protein
MANFLNIKTGLYMIILYGVFLGWLKVTNMPKVEEYRNLVTAPKEVNTTSEYPTFNTPVKASKILFALEPKVHLEEKHYLPYQLNESQPFHGYKPDSNYCAKRMRFFTEHTENVFGTPGIFIPESEEVLTKREIAPLFGTVIDPHITEKTVSLDRKNNTFWFKVNNTVWMPQLSLYRRRELGKQYSCLSQASNKIPGETALSRKDMVAQSTNNYADSFKDRPQCFNYDSLFPQTWVLYDKAQCQEFFNILKSEDYAQKKAIQRIVFIRKIGANAHRGKGVFPVNQEEEDYLKKLYREGAGCGIVKHNNVVQTFVNDALLINDFYKFDFRVFMLVASTNPMIGYYHDGYIRISLIPYNSSNAEDEKKMMLTNLMLNKDIYDDARNGKLYRGMDEQGLMNAQQTTSEQLGEYLLGKGIITDPNWVQNYLRREMKKAMLHLMRMAKDTFAVDSSLFQLFGVDFMLDKDLKLWFIEANGGPALPKYIPAVHTVMTSMLRGQYEIVLGLLRSRMKRVINYVNSVSKSIEAAPNRIDIIIPDLAAKREEFAKINKNYFEKEYELSPENTWQKFMDENLEGEDRYAGLISPECY